MLSRAGLTGGGPVRVVGEAEERRSRVIIIAFIAFGKETQGAIDRLVDSVQQTAVLVHGVIS